VAGRQLFGSQEIYSFKAYDAAPAVLDENDIIVRFFADMFFAWIIEPDT
jgi:hypothetical protein